MFHFIESDTFSLELKTCVQCKKDWHLGIECLSVVDVLLSTPNSSHLLSFLFLKRTTWILQQIFCVPAFLFSIMNCLHLPNLICSRLILRVSVCARLDTDREWESVWNELNLLKHSGKREASFIFRNLFRCLPPEIYICLVVFASVEAEAEAGERKQLNGEKKQAPTRE